MYIRLRYCDSTSVYCAWNGVLFIEYNLETRDDNWTLKPSLNESLDNIVIASAVGVMHIKCRVA